MFVRNWNQVLAAGLVAATLAVPALAADNDSNGWWGRSMGRMMGMNGPMMGRNADGPMMGFGPDDMLDRIDGRLAFLKAELKIGDAQQAAWDDFAQAVRSTAETRNAMMRSMMEEMRDGEYFKKPLPDRLILQETHLEARLEEVRTIKEAVDKLYAVLSDEQKETADETVLPMMGMGRGRMRGPQGRN